LAAKKSICLNNHAYTVLYAVNNNMEPTREPDKAPDIWRGSLLRYAGYANEVGEAFRHVYPRLVGPSYGVALLYVLGDTVDKSRRAAVEGRDRAAVTYAAFDVAAWQLLASVAIPGAAINQIVSLARRGVAASKGRLPPAVSAWGPTAVGLAAIPFIVQPIDRAVDAAFDASLRPWAKARGFVAADPAASADAASLPASSPAVLATYGGGGGAMSGATGGGGGGHDRLPSGATAVTSGAGEGLALSSMTLLAAAPAIATSCAGANRAFLACKRRHADPERCLSFGADCIRCGARAVRTLATHPLVAPTFGAYSWCLECAGGELRKCNAERQALEEAWHDLTESWMAESRTEAHGSAISGSALAGRGAIGK